MIINIRSLRKTFSSFSQQRYQLSSLPSHKPNNHSHPYHTPLSSCKNLNSLIQIHAHLIVFGFKLDNFTSTQLINTYSLFKKCEVARSVFDSIPNPSVLLWNSMIRAYTRSNQHQEALNMYNYMLEKSVQPDKYTFTFILKACTGVLDLQKGVVIHREITNEGLESDVFIATGLVDMYSKMGHLTRARDVFDKMLKKDVVAWNAMIAGLSQSSSPRDALRLFRSMQLSGGVEPNSVSLLNLFPAVSKLLDIKSCKSINGYVLRRSFPVAVSNGLIDMYSKCGNADIACRIFDQMQDKDDVSWGTIMAGYAHNGCFSDVLELFDEMKRENVKMNTVSAVSALLAAADMRDLKKGMEIHDSAIKQRIDSSILVATPLMKMYAKCGDLDKVKELFKGLKGKDLVAWSAVIAAFAQSGYPEEAVSLFQNMQNENFKPNRVSLVSVIPACAELSSLKLGKSLHCFAIKNDMGYDVLTGTALVSMYAKCSLFIYALIIFDKMPQKDVVTWNALINGYAQIGDAYSAMEMFRQLQLSGFLPDSGTMVGVVPACALMGDLGQGTRIHGKIIKFGFESDCHVANALVDMYAKCGDICSAEFLFKITEFAKDKVSWNVMITVYMQSGRAKEAISTFHQMKFEGFQPNLVTIVSILPAAANLTSLKEGTGFHAYVIQMGLESNTLVGNSLIDMYAKCGHLDYAEKIFSKMENKDTITWNVILSAYAMHGLGERATEFFSLMQESSVEVDSVSFISVLSACRHAGLVDEGRNIFYSMREKHRIKPDLEHYACVVDLLGRAGLFDETMGLIETMPMEADAGVWGALLGACRMHSNVKLAEVALNYLVKLEPRNSAHYVVLSNIYAQSDRWSDARSTRDKMNETGLKKTPGCSWVGQKQVEVK